MSDPSGGRRRLPLVLGSGAVVVVAIIAIAIGVNGASSPLPPLSTPTPTAAVPTPTPSIRRRHRPRPSRSRTARPPNSAPVLKPINPPASVHTYSAAPAMTINTTKLYQATIATAKGNIVLCLQPDLAPNTVNVFVTLARNHFYDGIPFHRVVAAFVDPGWRSAVHRPRAGSCRRRRPRRAAAGVPGSSSTTNRCISSTSKARVAMANSGANTNGSQFFICIADDSTKLAPSYNLFGKVETGMSVALVIAQGDVMKSITVREQT